MQPQLLSVNSSDFSVVNVSFLSTSNRICRKQKDLRSKNILRFANFLSLGKHVETFVTVVFE